MLQVLHNCWVPRNLHWSVFWLVDLQTAVFWLVENNYLFWQVWCWESGDTRSVWGMWTIWTTTEMSNSQHKFLKYFLSALTERGDMVCSTRGLTRNCWDARESLKLYSIHFLRAEGCPTNDGLDVRPISWVQLHSGQQQLQHRLESSSVKVFKMLSTFTFYWHCPIKALDRTNI